MAKQDQNEPTEKKFDFFELTKLKDNKLHRKSRLSWTEEAYINFSEKEINKSDKIFFGLSIDNKVLKVFLFIIFISLGILLGRAVQLQVVQGEEYLQTAEQNRLRVHYVKASRGIIYDRQGRPLVSNIPNFSLFVTPFDFPQDEQKQKEIKDNLEELIEADLSENMNEILKKDPRQKEYFEPLLLYEDIPYQKALRLEILTASMPGVSIEYDTKRHYLFTEQNDADQFLYNSLSHVIGYEGKLSENEYDDLHGVGYLLNDRIGKTGVEYSYEKILRGKHGKKQVEVDSQGKEKKIIAKENAERGKGVILSIDLEIQNKLEEILRNTLIENEKKKGVAIAMNPQNGEILAMISLPSYDNNDFATGIDSDKYKLLIENENNPLFNRTIKGEYPSGSTIKPVIASAALEEGIVNESTTFLSTGGIRIGEWFFPDWRAGGHGLTDVKKAIADSVNTYFYTVGGGHGDFEGLGVKKINYYAALFGLGQQTGIDLAGEKPGFLPTPEWKYEIKEEQWYIGDTYHLSIGQGDLLVTPLQIANFTSVFANKGKFIKPHLVRQYIDPEQKTIFERKVEIERENFIEPYNISIIRQGLRQAVTFGSARLLNSLPETSGAKTGTAQWGKDRDPHAWFTSFAPYENAEIVVTVLVEEGEEGSTVAAPIAYDFLMWYFNEYKG